MRFYRVRYPGAQTPEVSMCISDRFQSQGIPLSVIIYIDYLCELQIVLK